MFEMVAAQEYGLELQQRPFHQENVPLGYQVDLNTQQYNSSHKVTEYHT